MTTRRRAAVAVTLGLVALGATGIGTLATGGDDQGAPRREPPRALGRAGADLQHAQPRQAGGVAEQGGVVLREVDHPVGEADLVQGAVGGGALDTGGLAVDGDGC